MITLTFAAMWMMFQSAPGVDFECPGMTTYAMRQCASYDIARTESRMTSYLDAAKERVSGPSADRILARIDASQSAWQLYANTTCDAMAHSLDGGSIAPLLVANCRLHLIDQRTHNIWQFWLVPMSDSTQPFMPEPEPTPDSNTLPNPN